MVPFLAAQQYARAARYPCNQKHIAATIAVLTTRATIVSRKISSTVNKPLKWLVRSWKNHIKNYYVDS